MEYKIRESCGMCRVFTKSSSREKMREDLLLVMLWDFPFSPFV